MRRVTPLGSEPDLSEAATESQICVAFSSCSGDGPRLSEPSYPRRQSLCYQGGKGRLVRTAGAAHKRAFHPCDSQILTCWHSSSAPGLGLDRVEMGRRESFVYRVIVFPPLPPVTGAKYEFNSRTGARKWKGSLMQTSNWKESSHPGAAASSAVSAGGTGPRRSTHKEGDGLSGQAQAADGGPDSRNDHGKPGIPKDRDPALQSRASPKPRPGK